MDGNVLSFEEFLATESYQVPMQGFLINLLLAGVLAIIVSWVYTRYGTSLSNRRMFARNFLPIAMTTMFIISVVKSSLALSLGLVGALSIVRFRTAIKEPEELAFLFLTIAIGLGLGADQRNITILTVLVVCLLLMIRKKYGKNTRLDQNMHLTVSSPESGKIDLKQIVSILDKYCTTVNLKRFDKTNDTIEASFLVKFEDFEGLAHVNDALTKISKKIKITFVDYQGT